MAEVTQLSPMATPGQRYAFVAKAESAGQVIVAMEFTHEEPSMEFTHEEPSMEFTHDS